MDAAVPLAVAAAVRATGMIAVAGLAATAALAPTARARALGMAGALALTPVLLVGEIWDSPQFHTVRGHPGAAAVAVLAALALVAALAALMTRRAWVLPVLAVVALPFRVPIEAGGSAANLLVPLYLVVAAGAVACIAEALRRPATPTRPAGRVDALLLGSVVLYALQAAYSSDLSKALENVVFFYVPFALLFVLLREVAWTRRLGLMCLGALTGLALAFAGIGFVEYGSRQLLLNPKVINSNEFASYFRVNSLFFDPNIYGRFLAIVMLLVAAAMLWTARPRVTLAAAAVLGVLWGGLVLTFSQSSFGALLLGLVVLAALRWSRRWTLAVAGVVAVIAAAFVVAFPSAVRLDLESSKSLDKASSGRVDLISGGLELFRDRPVEGYGAGAFVHEYRRQKKASSERAASASHTIPVTVAAEQGVLGLALYLALVIAAGVTLLRGAHRRVERAAVGAAFVALVLHTFLYAAFLEDPIAWTLLAVGLALARPAAAAAAA